jgi:hypothetical protein
VVDNVEKDLYSEWEEVKWVVYSKDGDNRIAFVNR